MCATAKPHLAAPVLARAHYVGLVREVHQRAHHHLRVDLQRRHAVSQMTRTHSHSLAACQVELQGPSERLQPIQVAIVTGWCYSRGAHRALRVCKDAYAGINVVYQETGQPAGRMRHLSTCTNVAYMT